MVSGGNTRVKRRVRAGAALMDFAGLRKRRGDSLEELMAVEVFGGADCVRMNAHFNG